MLILDYESAKFYSELRQMALNAMNRVIQECIDIWDEIKNAFNEMYIEKESHPAMRKKEIFKKQILNSQVIINKPKRFQARSTC